MTPSIHNPNNPVTPSVLCGDNSALLREYPSETFDAIITDFPYGLGSRDPAPVEILQYLSGSGSLDTGGDVFHENWALPTISTILEMVRVLKPGGYFVTFAATRTFDIISMSLRMAGLENRDVMTCCMGPPVLQWMYAQGVPKNFDLGRVKETLKGLGTALKPAWEPILIFRKPLQEATLHEQYEATGTGVLNIEASKLLSGRYPSNVIMVHTPWCQKVGTKTIKTSTGRQGGKDGIGKLQDPNAKWGLINTGIDTGYGDEHGNEVVDDWRCQDFCPSYHLNRQEPNVSRYFLNIAPTLESFAPFRFVGKSTKTQRHEGLPEGIHNTHVTPKPIEIMRYLVTLICRPGAHILDPYCGSGATLLAAKRANCTAVGMEIDPEYAELSRYRLGLQEPQHIEIQRAPTVDFF